MFKIKEIAITLVFGLLFVGIFLYIIHNFEIEKDNPEMDEEYYQKQSDSITSGKPMNYEKQNR